MTARWFFCATRLLPLRRGLRAADAGHRGLRRRRRPPAALAGGPRPRRQARRRDRQRRDGGDRRPGDGRDRRARDDAPALAVLHPPAAVARPARRVAVREAERGARVRDRAAQEHRAAGRRLLAVPARSRARCARSSAASRPSGCRPTARSTCTSTRPTTRGTSASASCPTATCSRRCARGRHRSSPTSIATFTEHGIRLRSGAELDADIVVTATGLDLLAFGGIELVVDGREIALPETLAYRGTMLGGVPNFAYAIGYTNASWTLKVDLVCEYLCRVLSHLDADRRRRVRPRAAGRRADAAAARLPGRLRPAGARPVPATGRAGAVAARDELLRGREERCAAARSTTGRCGASPRPATAAVAA